jgi:predicted PurR-regulated permease PerM
VIRLLIIVGIFSLAWIAWHLRGLLVLVFGAVLVSVILRIVARPIHTRMRLSSAVALALAVLLLAGLFSLILWLFGAEIARQTRTLDELVPAAWQSLQARLDGWGLGNFARRWVATFGGGDGGLTNLGRFAISVGNGIADSLLVIVGGIYLAAQPNLYQTGLVKMMPPRSRPLVAEALKECGDTLTLWLKGRLISMVAVGVLTAIGLKLIGVPSWLSLALLSALLEFIPFIGPIVAAVPAVLLALAFNPQAALWTALLYLFVQQIEGNVIEPLVQQRAVTIPPALLLFAMVAAALLFGISGVVLGAPLTVVLYVLVKQLYVREVLHTETPLPTEQKK